MAFVYTLKQFAKKFDLRGQRMILVGYEGDSTNYRVYDPATKQVKVTRDVTFHERIGKVEIGEDGDEDEMIVLRSAKQEVQQRDVLDEREAQQREEVREVGNQGQKAQDEEKEQQSEEGEGRELRRRDTIRRLSRYNLEVNIAEYVTPNSYEEAKRSIDAAQWAHAIEEELQAHNTNKTWTIVPKTPGTKTIDFKWVFRVKEDPQRIEFSDSKRDCMRVVSYNSAGSTTRRHLHRSCDTTRSVYSWQP